MTKSYQDMNVGELMVKINDTAKAKGWWDGWDDLPEDQKLDKIAGKLLLIHAEVSEAAEEMRNVNKLKEMGFDLTDIYYYDEVSADVSDAFMLFVQDDDGMREARMNKPEGFVVEMVDAVVRVLDTAAQMNLPFVRALAEKLSYNDTRSVRHGGKSF